MPRKRFEELNDAKCRQAKPEKKPKKLVDGDGLYLLVEPSGAKGWRLRYRYDGKERLMSLGPYPRTSLKDARKEKNEIKRRISAGLTPRPKKIVEGGGDDNPTFKECAMAWAENPGKARGRAPSQSTIDMLVRRMELYVFDYIGDMSINELRPRHVLEVIERIEAAGLHETARRMLITIQRICRRAALKEDLAHDPCIGVADQMQGVETRHYSAITEPKELTELLRAIDGYEGSYVVRCALRLAPLVFVRPGELRKMEWSEVNWEEGRWEISAEKMKMKRPHIVPLSRQALEVLRDVQRLTSVSGYVFPSSRSNKRSLSDNTLNAALRRMDFSKDKVTTHGFRATARTMIAEQLKYRSELIEHQLAHTVRDPHGRAYNRTDFLDERAEMMQAWADYLDGLRG